MIVTKYAEEWKEIPNTDYSVSTEGRVASRKYGKWRILKLWVDHGYARAHLLIDGNSKLRRVHQLVAEAFLGPKPTLRHEVNHISGDGTDNRFENLEWVTPKENSRHRFDVLKRGNAHGEEHGRAILTEANVREIRKRISLGEKQGRIATRFGVSRATVNVINTRKKWAWLI